MFITPGYAALTKSEFTRDFFKKMFKLAFMPSKAKELTTFLISAPIWQKAQLEHYQKIKAKRLEILAATEKLKDSQISTDALRKALEYLPSLEAEECPPVSFVVFGNEARGYSPVVVDIVKAIESKDDLECLLAHEFHHYLRNKFLSFNPARIEPEDENIIWVLNQLQCEGIADLIDMKPKFADPEFIRSEYYSLFEKSVDIIHELDSLFVRISAFPDQKETLGLQLKKSIPWSGHPTGFYMARKILEQNGKAALISDIGNPFRFIELYQDAALGNGRGIPVFSTKALELIQKLGNKYASLPSHRKLKWENAETAE
jgi:hypothetical protein